MDLIPSTKAIIDSFSYETLLYHWRFAKSGDPWFQGETGEYWGRRMRELKGTVDHVAISKKVGHEPNWASRVVKQEIERLVLGGD